MLRIAAAITRVDRALAIIQREAALDRQALPKGQARPGTRQAEAPPGGVPTTSAPYLSSW